MFVLKNAWAHTVRHKWRSLLAILVAIVVAFGSMFGLAERAAADKATGSDYESQQVVASLRPTAATRATYDGTDSSYTSNYLGWTDYNTIGISFQSATGQSPNPTATVSLPVRQTGDVKAIPGTADQPADKTGGEFTLRGFYSTEAADANYDGRFTIVSGKNLEYQTTEALTGNEVLVSKALAAKDGLKVGSKFKVTNPTDTAKAYELEVRGIYEYTDPGTTSNTNTKLAKDNRDNVIFTTYAVINQNSLADTNETAKGWAKPDLDLGFILTDVAQYRTFTSVAKKDKVASKYQVVAPSLERYEESIAPLKNLDAAMRTALPSLWFVGGLLLLALTLLGVAGRRDEIGMAIMSGVSRPRLGWQFMLESFIVLLPGFAIGAVAGGFAAGPLGNALGAGRATPVDAGIVWKVIWIGLAAVLALAIVAMLRAVAVHTDVLFAARSDAGDADDSATASDSADDKNADGEHADSDSKETDR